MLILLVMPIKTHHNIVADNIDGVIDSLEEASEIWFNGSMIT